MKTLITFLLCLLAVEAFPAAQPSTPINNGVLQSPLNGNGQKITNAVLAIGGTAVQTNGDNSLTINASGGAASVAQSNGIVTVTNAGVVYISTNGLPVAAATNAQNLTGSGTSGYIYGNNGTWPWGNTNGYWYGPGTNSATTNALYATNLTGTLPYTQVTGTPSALPPNGAAGGALTDSYPNPDLITAVPITNFNEHGIGTNTGTMMVLTNNNMGGVFPTLRFSATGAIATNAELGGGNGFFNISSPGFGGAILSLNLNNRTASFIGNLSGNSNFNAATLTIGNGMSVDSSGNETNLTLTTGAITNSGLTASTLTGTDANKQLISYSLGTGLSFSGTTLNATGGGGSGSQTPLTNTVNAATYSITNLGGLSGTAGPGLTNLPVNWFNVVAYGASPSFATDSTAAIAAAAAAADKVGGTLYFPSMLAGSSQSQYSTTNTIVLTNNGTRIVGDGMMSVLLGLNAAGKPLILFTNATQSTYGGVENMSLYDNDSGFSTNKVGILSRHGGGIGSKVNVHNVYFNGFCYQYQATSDAEFDISGCRFLLNPSGGTNGVASIFVANINNSDTGDYFVHANYFTDSGTSGWSMELQNGSGPKIYGNKFNSSGDGTHGYQHHVYVHNSPGAQGLSICLIEDNSIENSLAEAIYVDADNGNFPWDSWIISGNEFLMPSGNGSYPILMVNGEGNKSIIGPNNFNNVASAACVDLYNMTNITLYPGYQNGLPLLTQGGTCANITNYDASMLPFLGLNNPFTGNNSFTGTTAMNGATAETLTVTNTTTLGNQTNTGTLGVAGASTLAGAVNANGITADNVNVSNYLAQNIGTLAIASTTNVTVDFHNPDVETAATLTANVNLLQTTNRTASVENKHIVWLYPNGTNRTISFNSSWHGNVLGTLGTSQANITLTNSTFASVVFSCNGSSETNICFVYSVWQ